MAAAAAIAKAPFGLAGTRLVTLPRPCTFDPRYSLDEAPRLFRTAFFLVAPARCPVAAELRNTGPTKAYKDQQKSHPDFAGSAVICRNKDHAAGWVLRGGGDAGPESPVGCRRNHAERALRV